MRYAFPCNIVRDDEEAEATGREAYVVTFPDVYGANTGAMVVERGFGDGRGLPGRCPGWICQGV